MGYSSPALTVPEFKDIHSTELGWNATTETVIDGSEICSDSMVDLNSLLRNRICGATDFIQAHYNWLMVRLTSLLYIS